MKILFLIGYPPKYEASNWKEIVRYSNDYIAFDEEFYQIIKALEYNEEFEREVIKSRIRLKIPDVGYAWREYQKISDYSRKDVSDIEIAKMLFLIRTIPKEVSRIIKRLKLNKRIRSELKDIILTSSVCSPDYLSDIHYWLEPDDRFELMDDDEKEEAKEIIKSFNIAFTRKVTKNELIKFIENNWSNFKKRMELLPEKERYYISERDLRIVELRDKKNFKYGDIASQIIKEFLLDNIESTVNEDSVKTSYKRAKRKIVALAKSQEK